MDGRPPFEEVYREYLPRVYGFLRVQLRSAEDAEDVTAQVFMKAYQAYGRYQPRAQTPSAWLFRIARNAMYDHLRGRGRRERLERALAREPASEADPSQVAEARIEHEALAAAVNSLGARQREAVALRHSGLGFKEIGEMMDCSEDAAKMLYHRALKALRESLER